MKIGLTTNKPMSSPVLHIQEKSDLALVPNVCVSQCFKFFYVVFSLINIEYVDVVNHFKIVKAPGKCNLLEF